MKASNLALAASGTVALETALAEVPTVIAYKVSPLTAFIVRRLIKVNYVNIINVLAGKEIVPECLQEKCSPDVLADILGEFRRCLANPKFSRFGLILANWHHRKGDRQRWPRSI